MLSFLGKILRPNDREIARLTQKVEAVNSLTDKTTRLADQELSKTTARLRLRAQRGDSLDDLLPEAFALAREASFRANGERPFDVQVLAAIALHEGKIAEQKTGEGKTLTAALPLYLNALTGRGVHLVTVNDYLAKVGVGWMGRIYHLLGLSCAAMIHDNSFIFDPDFVDSQAADWRLSHLRPVSRKEAYGADITYGINSEFGFDYLRDNMARTGAELVQRDFHFAIVDEVDSVLIDEARTPHIISAPDAAPTKKYYEYARLVEKLTPKLDYEVDEKLRTAHLTDHGIGKIESLLGVKDVYEKDFATVHHLEAALKARTLYQKEKDYIVRDNEVIIVDEFTGRLMPGRRWSEGIHQAVEAKEDVPIQQESRTLATISLQNYFRKYEKLAGMTGTAATEAEEFHKIYGLEVLTVPTNRPNVRKDFADQVYKTQRAKYAAVIRDIEEAHRTGRPVLIGTTSIEKNEIVSQFLRHKGITHQVLNAKQHEKEALIISQAGQKGAVTVATNMAGRGVDIILGGNPPKKADGSPDVGSREWATWQNAHDEVVALGGLHVIGTERHESRRIDNQLRGRAGRQGDPGSSRFFVALDDEIMRLFGGEQVSRLMTFFNIPEDQSLEHAMVTKSIEQAQSKVEQFNFDSRKHLLEYDDVMNKQREIIYGLRRRVLDAVAGDPTNSPAETADWLRLETQGKIDREIATIAAAYQSSEPGEPQKLLEEFSAVIPFDPASLKAIGEQLAAKNDQERTDLLQKIARDIYAGREKQYGAQTVRFIEQQEMLRVIDGLWMEHLEAIDDLREGIGLRGYAQRDPLVEYKSEAFSMFEKLMAALDYEFVRRIYRISVATPEQISQMQRLVTNAGQIETQPDIASLVPTDKASALPPASVPVSGPPGTNNTPGTADHSRPGRNDPCWCGSGKKYKKCHYPN